LRAPEEEVDEQSLDRRRLVADLVIARGGLARELKPVQRRLARHRGAVAAASLKLGRQNRHQRVVTKLVVIIEVLIAERNPERPLTDERGDRVLDEPRVSGVAETSRKSAEPDPDVAPRRLRARRPRRTSSPTVELGPTGHPSTRPNTLGSALHSVGIGSLSDSAQVVLAKQLLPDSETRCAT
jgi:hypothetical protein